MSYLQAQDSVWYVDYNSKGLFLVLLCIAFLVSCAGGPVTSLGTVGWHSRYGIDSKEGCQNPQNLANLVKATESVNPKVRIEAIRCISSIGAEATSAIPAIADKMLFDGNGRVRKEAEYAIYGIGFQSSPEIVGLVLAALTDENDNIKLRGMHFIKKMSFAQGELKQFQGPLNELSQKSTRESVKNQALILASDIRLLQISTPVIKKISVGTEQNLILKAEPLFNYYNGYRTVYPTKKGILPIRIDIKNQLDKPCSIEPSASRLESVDGTKAVQADFQQVVDRLFYTWTTQAGARANTKIIGFHKKNILKRCNVDPNSSITGLLFFIVPSRLRTVKDWRLEVEIRSSDNNETHLLATTF